MWLFLQIKCPFCVCPYIILGPLILKTRMAQSESNSKTVKIRRSTSPQGDEARTLAGLPLPSTPKDLLQRILDPLRADYLAVSLK